ncbi:MAG: long-chain fatty acid--CoA ligase [Acidimicrobiales bacterium]|nr:long-chain fatty acid--CoA ligase [Acidimicrobiales bacterium]
MPTASIEEIDRAVRGDTAPRAFLRTVAAAADVPALRAMAGEASWEESTFRRYADQVATVAAALRTAGLDAGDRLLLMMRNRPEFHVVDTAAQFLRATPFSVYNSSSAEEIQYQGAHSGARVAVVEDAGFLRRLLAVRGELPALERIYVIDRPDDAPDDVLPYTALLEGHTPLDLAALAEETDPADLATLIYTSGTTGPPKGVMISQYNVVYTVEQLRRCLDLEHTAGVRLVSYLPMAHIAERMLSHYSAMCNGFSVTTCPDPTAIATYAKEVHPEVLFGVPRVWEKVYAGVNGALSLDPDKKKSFDEGVAAALPIKEAERNGTVTQEQRDVWAFLDAVAFSLVRNLVGLDQVKVAVTGAAPIPREVLEWFNAVGVPLSEIYGMSESSGPMTWDAWDIRPGTVGRVLPGGELRLAEDGEVLYRGGNVFVGYLNEPAKTADTIVDGWLYSGDIGELDEDGYLRIVDRKKELIITAGGKNISPANLEAALKTIPMIGQAAAIGDGRKYVTALLVLDPELAPLWAMQQGIEFTDLADLATKAAVIDEVQRGVEEINIRFAQAEQIKKFTLLGEEWLPDTDVLTPTSKLKRRGVLARYADEIEQMY